VNRGGAGNILQPPDAPRTANRVELRTAWRRRKRRMRSPAQRSPGAHAEQTRAQMKPSMRHPTAAWWPRRTPLPPWWLYRGGPKGRMTCRRGSAPRRVPGAGPLGGPVDRDANSPSAQQRSPRSRAARTWRRRTHCSPGQQRLRATAARTSCPRCPRHRRAVVSVCHRESPLWLTST